MILVGAFVPVMLKDSSTHSEGIKVTVRTTRLLAKVELDILPGIVTPKESVRRKYLASIGLRPDALSF